MIKRKFNFENCKNCLEVTQLDNKMKDLKKNTINIEIIENIEVIKNSQKNNKLVLQTQQRFKSKSHNVSTEEIDKISLSSNDDQIMQSIDLIETHASGKSKYLVSGKEEIKCNNTIKRYQK